MIGYAVAAGAGLGIAAVAAILWLRELLGPHWPDLPGRFAERIGLPKLLPGETPFPAPEGSAGQGGLGGLPPDETPLPSAPVAAPTTAAKEGDILRDILGWRHKHDA
jgi:hypothetical protein